MGPTNYSYGMSENNSASDGPTTGSDIDGLSALTSTSTDGGNIYFSINDSIAYEGDYSATFTVEYYDSGTGSFQVQYDNGTSNPYQAATPNIPLTNTDTWKTATVTATGAYFGDKQNGGADFRLRDGSGQITVHSVAVKISGDGVANVTDFPPVPAITSPQGGQAVTLASAVSGTSEPDAQVTVNEGSTALCTATATDAGTWSCAPASGLSQGRQSVTATATDPTGLSSAASPAVSFYASDQPSGTAVVGAVVGATNYSYGMSQDDVPSSGFDGPTTASDVDGLSALTSTSTDGGNIYFQINQSIAYEGDYSATFTVEYYDSGTGSFQVQYDNGTSNPYQVATPSIPLTNTDTWKTATVTATGAYFGGDQHSAADFRLRNGGGQVTVHSVAVTISGDGVPNVTDFAPAVAITSPAAGATVTTTPTVSGTSEPDAAVTVDASGTAICTATASDSGAWSCTPSAPLGDGAYTLTATAADAVASPVTSPPVQVTVAG